jgi:hypothetical protein
MSMAFAALMSARVEMAPALCQPLSERVDFHWCSPISLGGG